MLAHHYIIISIISIVVIFAIIDARIHAQGSSRSLVSLMLPCSRAGQRSVPSVVAEFGIFISPYLHQVLFTNLCAGLQIKPFRKRKIKRLQIKENELLSNGMILDCYVTHFSLNALTFEFFFLTVSTNWYCAYTLGTIPKPGVSITFFSVWMILRVSSLHLKCVLVFMQL